jgi:hypothetical protein
MKLFGYLKKVLKQTCLESSFSTETYLKAQLTYGGDEDCFKGGAKKSVKAGKDGKVVEQKNVCT